MSQRTLQNLRNEADDLAFRQAEFDSEELPEKPLIRALVIEARGIRQEKLTVLKRAIERYAGRFA